ncbi:hypothetical protein FOS14_18505 [Skermania sp. ID1734]|uniref:hypothetical protein n=1 Tax=Skermania sp. ID1734 TaxID=2597516 RepID=UPI00117D541F|nr:hypothetical protein [Skermania sp. ID1734]TSD95350.1 hypothetical protein FOS14_18505 [Skermania sp. ID1734]
MFVLTVDQRSSRRNADLVPELLADLAGKPMLRAFERTAGDEVQGVTDNPATAVDVALDLVRRGNWRVGIGVGPVETPLPPVTRAGRGPAFEAARAAVTRAKNSPTGLAVEGVNSPAVADAEAALNLLAELLGRRTEQGHAAVAQMRAGRNQSEAAANLGITKQAMSQRLAAAGWHVENPGRTLAARLLSEADTE